MVTIPVWQADAMGGKIQPAADNENQGCHPERRKKNDAPISAETAVERLSHTFLKRSGWPSASELPRSNEWCGALDGKPRLLDCRARSASRPGEDFRRMDFDRLYFVEDPCTRGALVVDSERIEYPPRLFWGEEQPATPLHFTHAMGGKPRDVIWTTYGFLYLVSQRVITVLGENRFTGWTTFPAEVCGKGNERIEGYHGFAVTGRAGEEDLTRRVKVRLPADRGPNSGLEAWLGVYFDPASWDGSDVFILAGGLRAIIAEPVKAALERARIRNLLYTRLTEVEDPIYPDLGPPGLQFYASDLRGKTLTGLRLVNANLFGADLRGAIVGRVDMTRAELRHADLRGVDLSQANLSEALLYGARYDENTRWPFGFDPQQHGAVLTTTRDLQP
jgi:hypothetical protein